MRARLPFVTLRARRTVLRGPGVSWDALAQPVATTTELKTVGWWHLEMIKGELSYNCKVPAYILQEYINCHS